MYRYAFLALLPLTSLAGHVGDGVHLEKKQISVSVGLPTEIGSNSSTQDPTTSTSSPDSNSSTVPTSTSTPSTTTSSVVTTTTTTSPSPTTSSSTVSTTTEPSPTSTSSEQSSSETTTSVGSGTTTGSRTTTGSSSTTTTSRPSGTTLPSDGNGGSSGLSENSKKVIGGVVGGVGGALLIGALAFTAWRIWGKKKSALDEDFYDPNRNEEKLSTSTETTPFRTTLDQYHQPNPSNTASNF